jgi:PBSX family phage portal protein
MSTETAQTGKSLCFAFGDPEPILTNAVMDYLGVFMNFDGTYYRPPVDLDGLARLMGANSYHGPILHFKANMIVKCFIPSKIISTQALRFAALDFAVLANAYFQIFTNGFNTPVRLERLPALSMRRGKNPDEFVKLEADGKITTFKPGEVLHIKEPDIRQSIYGIPQYLGGIQSVLLSEDSTLFRRKFYINGAHMGYILVTNDANLDDETAKQIEKKVKESKGPGNFRSLYLNIPRSSSKEPVQIIPVGNIGTKDEFQAIKEVTEMEMLAMHRVYPGLVGIMPANVGGFGDLDKSMRVYHELEVTAMQQVFLQINEMIGGTPVAFRDPVWANQQ